MTRPLKMLLVVCNVEKWLSARLEASQSRNLLVRVQVDMSVS